jgi:ubiquitin-conjugating enzyme E2 M
LHPNIDTKGGVCLNILRDDWSPSLDLQTVILGLLHLFYYPNAFDPLDFEAAELMKTDPVGFERRVKLMIHGGRSYY